MVMFELFKKSPRSDRGDSNVPTTQAPKNSEILSPSGASTTIGGCEDLVQLILSYLDVKSRVATCPVSRVWQKCAMHRNQWQNIFWSFTNWMAPLRLKENASSSTKRASSRLVLHNLKLPKFCDHSAFVRINMYPRKHVPTRNGKYQKTAFQPFEMLEMRIPPHKYLKQLFIALWKSNAFLYLHNPPQDLSQLHETLHSLGMEGIKAGIRHITCHFTTMPQERQIAIPSSLQSFAFKFTSDSSVQSTHWCWRQILSAIHPSALRIVSLQWQLHPRFVTSPELASAITNIEFLVLRDIRVPSALILQVLLDLCPLVKHLRIGEVYTLQKSHRSNRDVVQIPASVESLYFYVGFSYCHIMYNLSNCENLALLSVGVRETSDYSSRLSFENRLPLFCTKNLDSLRYVCASCVPESHYHSPDSLIGWSIGGCHYFNSLMVKGRETKREGLRVICQLDWKMIAEAVLAIVFPSPSDKGARDLLVNKQWKMFASFEKWFKQVGEFWWFVIMSHSADSEFIRSLGDDLSMRKLLQYFCLA